MKQTMISGKMALIALAAVCLLAAPALSMPMGDGSCRPGHGAMFDMKNNLTPEELDNMTLGELKEMQRESMNQSQCAGGDKNCSQDCRGPEARMMGRDGQAGQMMKGDGPNCQMMGKDGQNGQMMKGDGPNGRMMGRDGQAGQCQGSCHDDGANRNMFGGNQAFLLMDDLNAEDISNMTVGQVRDMIQTKMQELDNMTLSQIKQLKLEKMQRMENMTLSELKQENLERQEMAGILGLAAFRPEPAA
ncbi:MAG: hypothetical protein CG440_805 [Methanosaeta sp. NSM2]|nr:hypothetical protein [Methanothrix sp.]OYV14153.1 MAG: hypothetical protein CG440_805 [Methanosaeta sp. NSM2]